MIGQIHDRERNGGEENHAVQDRNDGGHPARAGAGAAFLPQFVRGTEGVAGDDERTERHPRQAQRDEAGHRAGGKPDHRAGKQPDRQDILAAEQARAIPDHRAGDEQHRMGESVQRHARHGTLDDP